jgi:hypothetical protein
VGEAYRILPPPVNNVNDFPQIFRNCGPGLVNLYSTMKTDKTKADYPEKWHSRLSRVIQVVGTATHSYPLSDGRVDAITNMSQRSIGKLHRVKPGVLEVLRHHRQPQENAVYEIASCCYYHNTVNRPIGKAEPMALKRDLTPDSQFRLFVPCLYLMAAFRHGY